jgi:hypothetical protein
VTAPTIVNTRAAFRLSVLDAVRIELDGLAIPIEGGPLDGIQVVSIGSIAEASSGSRRARCPPIDVRAAEVKTPADVYVDAICPECNLPTRILVQLTTVLETTREAGSTIKLKAKAKGKTATSITSWRSRSWRTARRASISATSWGRMTT